MTRRLFVALGSFCLALFAVSAGAQAQSSINASVLLQGPNTALNGITVQVYTSTGTLVTSGTTSGGVPINIAVAAGTYYVNTFNGQNYVNRTYDGTTNGLACVVCAPNFSGPVAGSSSVTVVSGATPVTFHLATGPTISGTLRRADTNAGLDGISTILYNSSGTFVTSGFTSGGGNYSFPGGLLAGTYFVLTSNGLGWIDQVYAGVPCPLGNCSATSGTPISISASNVTANLTLSAGARINGQVMNSSNAIVPNPQIAIYNSVGNQVGFAFGDGSGNYTSGGLPTGDYFVKASGTGFVPKLHSGINCVNCSVTSGKVVALSAPSSPVAPITVNFTQVTSPITALEPGGSISGTVTNSVGAAVSGAGIQVYDATGSFVTASSTNGSGVYTASGLLTGQYFVKAFPPGAIGASTLVPRLYNGFDCPNCDVTTGTPVAVTQGLTTSAINMVMITGGTITGKVTGPSGNVSGLQMVILNAAGSQMGSVNTNGTGDYTFNGLLGGTYYVRTGTTIPGGLVPEIYKGAGQHETCYSCSINVGSAISVTNGNSTTVNLSLQAGGSLSGFVKSSASGTPAIQGVNVALFLSTSNSQLLSANTNASGAYSFSGLPTGDYFVRTTNTQGFVDEVYNNVPCQGCTVSTSGAPLHVTAPAAFGTSVDFLLDPGGRISGRITDAVTGLGISGSSARVFNANGIQVTTGTADASGNFLTSSGLTSGNYFVMSSNSLGYIDTLYNGIGCFGCSAISGTPVAVVKGSTTPNVNLALNVGGRLTGTVKGASNNNPIPWAGVLIYSSSGNQLQFASANSVGVYAFTGLPTGTYYVKTSASYLGFIDQLYSGIGCSGCTPTTGTPIDVTAGGTVSGIDFPLITGAIISGTVREQGTNAPIANVSVSAYTASNNYVGGTSTGADGSYFIKGLPSGSYYVSTSNNIGYINQTYGSPSGTECTSCTPSNATPIAVTVGGGNATARDFTLRQGGRITGRVTSNGTIGIGGATLTLYTAAGTFVTTTNTTAAGDYVFAGLGSGSFLIRTSNSQGFIDEVYDNLECLSCTPTTGTPITVTAGASTTGKDFVLAAGARIGGTVTDGSGNPISGITVQIFRSNGGGFVTSGVTGASGAWITNAGIPAGTYVARTSNSLGYIDQLFNGVQCLGCSVISGSPIVATLGNTTTGINFSLQQGGSISGVVTATIGGAPLQNVTVQVFTSTGSSVTSASTNGAGTYVLRGLPAGQYFLKTFNSQGYIDRIYNNFVSLGGTVTAGTPVAVLVGATTTGADFSLDTGSKIIGTVRSNEPGSPPLGGVSVQVYTPSGAFASSATTSPSGTYVVGGLPAGNYYARTSNSIGYVNVLYPSIACNSCSVTAGTLIPVPSGGSATADFTLPLGGSISGTVSAPGLVSGLVSVSAYTTQGTFMGSGSINAVGAYTISGLPTGSYVVRTSNSLSLIDQQYLGVVCLACNFSTGTPVAVTVGATRSGIDFTLAAGARISGTVRDAVTAAPLPNQNVQIYSQSNAFITSTSTNNVGDYVTSVGLPPGTYFARVNGLNGYISTLYSGIPCQNCASNTGTPIAVTTGVTAGIDFSMTLGGRISGRITDTGGSPLQGISVSVYLPTGEFVASGVSNFDGSYTTQGMPTGTYYLRTANSLGYVNKLYNNVNCVRCAVTAGAPVSVTVGTTTPNIDFSLALGGRISGAVTDAATGLPVTGVSLQIFDSTGVVVTSAGTNNLGTFLSSAGLTPGTYYVKANNSQGYVNQVYTGVACAICDARTGTPVAVTAGATTPNINFALSLGGRIAGTITGTSTDPISHTPVTGPLADVEVDVFTSGGGFATFAYSGTDGRFITAAGLPTGNYFLSTYNQSGFIDQLYLTVRPNGDPVTSATPCGTNCAVTSGEPVPVVLGATTSGKNFVLNQGGRIEGTITRESTGTPLSNVSVYVYDAAGIPIAFGFTDGLGHYVSDSGLSSGTYYVGTASGLGLLDRVYNGPGSNGLDCAGCDVKLGTAVPVAGGQTVSGINIALGGGETLSGTVTGADGTPLAGALVRLLSNTGKFVSSAKTNEAGVYKIPTALPAGTYFARTTNGLGFIDKLYDLSEFCLACDVTRGTPIVLDGLGSTSGINFALTQGGRISGTVTGITLTGPVPVPGTKVRVFTSAGSLVAESFTNGLGQYLSPGLPIGNYFVRTYNPAKFEDQIYNSAGNATCAPCTITQGSAVSVVQGGVHAGIDFKLAGGGFVSGYVINKDTGAPIQGVTVAVYREDTGLLVANTDPTNASGYYQISLPVGRYAVEPNPIPGFRPFVPVGSLFGAFARSTVVVDTGTETTGVGFAMLACSPLTVNPASLPLGAKGQLYGTTLTASGGTGPYTFSVTDGYLNTGLALVPASGFLAGTPVFAGTGNFTIGVTDSNQCGGTRAFALTACSFILSTTSQSATAAAGSGSITLSASATDCPWIVSTSAGWITVTSAASGVGNATVTFTFTANTAASPRTGTIVIGGQPFTVTQGGSTSSPAFGVVDTPTQGATGVAGSMAVTGWALDDVEVKRVKISRSPVAGEGPAEIYLGDATMVDGARPDVAAANPTLPFKTRAGWGYLLLTNMLPNQGNGPFTLHMDAVDAEGNTTRLGSRTFTGDNANAINPFGAIDTPSQGETISGNGFVNFGWALTPNPKLIPTDGSTITVYIDGVASGNPTYNNFRGDVASLFPGLSNTGGAIGFRIYDTTTWTNGVHTIAWVVVDSGGQAEGIGSRYFTVNNTLASLRFSPSRAGLRANAVSSSRAGAPVVGARTGFNKSDALLDLKADTRGVRSISVGQLGRVELRFGQTCGGVRGGLLAEGQSLSLPAGSTLDAGGVFSWMPGPAFLGTYELEFTVPSCTGGESKIPVSVTVLPGK